MSMSLRIRFWGVRGSIPSPGPATALVGGNTSCVEVRCNDELLIFDAGTGLRRLGEALMARGGAVSAHLLFSHVHWDHIQGLPFFPPLFRPDTKLKIFGSPSGASIDEVLELQMSPPVFPVQIATVPARIETAPVPVEIEIGDARVRAVELSHPDRVFAYRVDCGGRSVVYATDVEHPADGSVDDRLVELAAGADVLIYDSQYTPEEYEGRNGPSRRGWGHSTWREAARVADAARVGKLVLFHHDPSRDDAAVAAIEACAAVERAGTIAAREGLELALSSRLESAAA